MAKTIAISGKGGTGKTTLTALMIRSLMDRAHRPVLTVDADPNASLALALGLQPEGTVADLRDKVLEDNSPLTQGISKLQAFGMGCHQLLTESEGFDLLTMGRPEGPKCYCAVNNLLRSFMDELSGSYRYVITDNEAGMEHLSRRTTNNVDLLIIVAEPTQIGIITAERIIELSRSLPVSIGRIGIIWNKTTEKNNAEFDGADILGSVPYDKTVYDFAVDGKSVFDLAGDNPALTAVSQIMQRNLDTVKTK